MESIKKFPWEYGHGRANYINGPRVAGARSLPAKLDQVISSRNAATAAGRRAPGPGLFLSNELRAASVKLRAERRAASYELRAWSVEQQAINVGPIIERQAWRFAMIA